MAKAAAISQETRRKRPLRESAGVLRVRWQEILSFAEAVEDARKVRELHDLRIAAKRLRYTLELLAPVLGAGIKEILQIAEEIQERVGAIHDCDVLFPLLIETMAKETNAEKRRRPELGPPSYLAAEGLAALLARKRAEREARFEEFVHFWRALPPERVGHLLNERIAAALAKHEDGAASTEKATDAE